MKPTLNFVTGEANREAKLLYLIYFRLFGTEFFSEPFVTMRLVKISEFVSIVKQKWVEWLCASSLAIMFQVTFWYSHLQRSRSITGSGNAESTGYHAEITKYSLWCFISIISLPCSFLRRVFSRRAVLFSCIFSEISGGLLLAYWAVKSLLRSSLVSNEALSEFRTLTPFLFGSLIILVVGLILRKEL